MKNKEINEENKNENEINDDDKIKNNENNAKQNIFEKNKDKKEIKNENINDIEKKEEHNNNIIEDKNDGIKNKENENQKIIENQKLNEKDNIISNDNQQESLNNKQNEILNQENKENDKGKETEINQSKKEENQNIANNEKENLDNKQKESNINNDTVISKKENGVIGVIQKYKESEIASDENNKENQKGEIINMQQNINSQNSIQNEISDNKENIKEKKQEKTETLTQKEKKDENKIVKENQKELSYNKDLCKEIVSSLPVRKKGDYSNFKSAIKEKTEKLNDTEKSYVLYLWICENISYDTSALINPNFALKVPESVYDFGKASCQGYSNLFKDLSDFLNLEVKSVECYVKGYNYNVGSIILNSNHEYNVIKLNNKWYHIDCTWGAGDIDNNKFHKCFKDFYFLPDPEILIKTHFPENEEWQLTQKKYTLDEFLNGPEIRLEFHKLGFTNFYPNEGTILLKDSNTQKFIVYGDNLNTKGAMCCLLYYENNVYNQKLGTTKVNFYDDRFEADTIFNKKGKYRIQIFASDNREDNYVIILEYSVIVENDSEKEIFYPRFYRGNEGINVIEPLYDNLKSGENVKFIVKSNDYEKLIVCDDEKWIDMIKKENGFYELEIKIKAKKNDKVDICRPKGYNTISDLVSYNVV